MRTKLTTAALAALAAGLCAAVAASAALVPIYRNPMESPDQRGEAVKLSGARCGRGGSEHALRIVVGKRTRECAYRTPVIGRDLEIAATMRLLDKTPAPLRPKSFLALDLRSGGGGHYQLLVYPLQRKAELRKVVGGGVVKYLRIAKNVPTIQGVDKANKLRLRAFNITTGRLRGRCRIVAYVGDQLVGEYTDRAAGELQGRASGFAIGATKGANGVVGSVDDVVVRVPGPS